MMKKQRSETSDGGGRGEARGDARNDKSAPAGADGESFGPWLRRQREMREIDLREISDASKISLRYLQAFEENRFDELPADVFAKGFLRHYARFVGIDQEEAVNFFAQARKEADLQQGEDEITRVVRIRTGKSSSSRRRESANRRFVLVILLAAALLLLVIWQLSQWQQRQEVAEAPPPAVAIPTTPAPDETAETSGDGAAPAGEAATVVDPAAGVDPATGLPLAVGPDGLPLAPAQAGPGADPAALGQPAVPGVDPAATPPPAADPAQAPQQQVDAGDLIRVSIDFQSQCWVEALVDGKRQQSATRAQGESVMFGGNELIEIKLGDFQAAQVEVNGRAVQLKPDHQRGSTVRLRFDLPYVASLTGVPLETLQQALAQRKKTGTR